MTRRKGAPGDLHVVEPMTPRQRLDAMLDELEPDAIRTLAYLADRLLVGQRCYGKLDLATDRRDWRKERTAEIAPTTPSSAAFSTHTSGRTGWRAHLSVR